MAIKDGYIRWSDKAVAAVSWNSEEQTGSASVTDETTGTVYEIGGGGGSSDLDTVEVTFVNDTLSDITMYGGYAIEEGAYANIYIPSNTTNSFNLITYKEYCSVNVDTTVKVSNITTTGNIEVIPQPLDPTYVSSLDITGPGTVTFISNQS